MHKSNTCFIWKIYLRMFMVNVESYGNIFLYFCEIGKIKKYLILVYIAHVNGYKLDKYSLSDNGYKLDKYDPC